jgi:ABC-type antimicrobial peptide transport system permease subunit
MMVESLWQDVRHGVRMLVKNPGFTAVAVAVTMCILGLGASWTPVQRALRIDPAEILKG